MMTNKREKFLASALKEFGPSKATVTRAEVEKVCKKYKLNFPQWITKNAVARGEYSLTDTATKTVKEKPVKGPKVESIVPTTTAVPETMDFEPAMAMAGVTAPAVAEVSFVPEKFVGYVPFGNFNDVKKIIASKKFYPMFITGLSGNGKTLMAEQVHASLKKEIIRANITIETDEDDLLGGFRLVDGRTVWQNGPVVIAMERGATLLLDEVDLGSNKLLCLQPVLEGKPIFLKKINKVVRPAPGFTIIATANTKGQGSEDGKFIGTNVLNEAFLERFSITLEQEYPAIKTEETILQNMIETPDEKDLDFITKLVRWGDLIRKSYAASAVTEIISTRRLVHIIQAYSIFNKNRTKAISLCLNRFDAETKESFNSFYSKIDTEIEKEKEALLNPKPEVVEAPAPKADARNIPF